MHRGVRRDEVGRNLFDNGMDHCDTLLNEIRRGAATRANSKKMGGRMEEFLKDPANLAVYGPAVLVFLFIILEFRGRIRRMNERSRESKD